MQFNSEEVNVSLNELGSLIDFATNSILQSPNRFSTRTYIEPIEITGLNDDWTDEFNNKKNILWGLQNFQSKEYWISAALRFIEREIRKLPKKIEKTIPHVYKDDQEVLKKHLDNLILPYSYFHYKYLGKIRLLSRKFSGYQIGELIDENRVFDWIKQFEDPRRMELALYLLNATKFVRVQDFYNKCQELYNSLSNDEKDGLVVFQYGLPTEGTPAREKDFIDALKLLKKNF